MATEKYLVALREILQENGKLDQELKKWMNLSSLTNGRDVILKRISNCLSEGFKDPLKDLESADYNNLAYAIVFINKKIDKTLQVRNQRFLVTSECDQNEEGFKKFINERLQVSRNAIIEGENTYLTKDSSITEELIEESHYMRNSYIKSLLANPQLEEGFWGKKLDSKESIIKPISESSCQVVEGSGDGDDKGIKSWLHRNWRWIVPTVLLGILSLVGIYFVASRENQGPTKPLDPLPTTSNIARIVVNVVSSFFNSKSTKGIC